MHRLPLPRSQSFPPCRHPAAAVATGGGIFRIWLVALAAVLMALPTAGAADPIPWVALDGPGAPAVSYALLPPASGPGLRLALRIAPAFGQDRHAAAPRVELGWWTGEPTRAQAEGTIAEDGDARADIALTAPPEGVQPRLAFTVTWRDAAGQVLQRQRYRCLDRGAPHLELAADPRDWQVLDLAAYQERVADQALLLRIAVTQPMDGKLSVVIDDGAGRRVRNLVAGVPTAAGAHLLTWDGLDDLGQMVTPGAYRWRAAHHPGIVPEHRFSFANGGETMTQPFGSNHSRFEAVTTNGTAVFYGAPMTEGGWALIALNPADGTFLRGYRQIHGTGIQDVAVAADAEVFYAAHDGRSWLQKVDRSKPDWRVDSGITLTRYAVATGEVLPYPGTHQFAFVDTYVAGPGAPDARFHSDRSLTGMALLGDRLYIGSRHADGILVVDPRSAKPERTIAVPGLGALAAMPDGRLLVQSGDRLLALDPTSGARTVLHTPAGLQVRGLSVAPDGRIYVSDAASHQVLVLTADGAEQRRIGVPGGAYQGPFVAERLVQPRGLAVLGDRLWVAEDRRNPKRLTAWDLQTDRVVVQKDGNPPYGGAGGGFNRDDAGQWIGLRAGWRVNLETGAAQCTSVLQREAGHLGGAIEFAQHYQLFDQEGRTFVLGMAKAQILSELMPDGSLKDRAVIGSVSGFRYACGWEPPAAFVAAVDARFPGQNHADRGILRGVGMLWVDRDGEGDMDADEIQFTPESVTRFGGAYWGHDQYDLTWRYPVQIGGAMHLVTFAPNGWHDGGAPRYPDLQAAIDAAIPIDLQSKHFESTVDSRGNLWINGEPFMTAYAPDGRQLWRYPNLWVGVHGSHKAPLPEVGVMQGNLFFLGAAPLDADTDVAMIVGNHGRCFVLTSDGFYLDEMFSDVRVSRQRDAWMIGGEAFGGVFGRDPQGRHWLQVGNDGYRIYRVTGLDQLQRSGGELPVSAAQIATAERVNARRLAPAVAAAPDSRSPFRWDRDGQFPVTVDLHVAGDRLQLRYQVHDDRSPWVNNGTDITTLFKSGDAIDLQLATDPTADPRRRDAGAGDIRLLIAPMGKETVAVLYDYVDPDATTAPVAFTSPWRRVDIARVQGLDAAQIAVRRESQGYTVTAAIPLADLGLGAPLPDLRGDLGVIYGDADGSMNVMRSYWANPSTALVSDVPGEAMLTPQAWGTLRLAPLPPAAWQLVDAGVLGNSGGRGDTLVPHGDRVAYGLGVARDAAGHLWDRAGAGILVAYRPDGSLWRSYPLPAGDPRVRADAIACTGDTLVLLLNGQLYRLATDAPAGTAPTPLGLAADHMSLASHAGRVAIVSGRTAALLDPVSGDRQALPPPTDGRGIQGIVLGPDGQVVIDYGHLDLNGARPQILGDFWYSQGWHSTISRFNARRQADPGVVLGGNSGHYIGTVDEPAEIIYGRGMARLGDSPWYAVSGEEGILHLLHWSAADRRFTVERRLGPLPFAAGLAIDAAGRVFVNRGAWDAGALPTTPQRDGGPILALGQAAPLPGGGFAMAAYQYGSTQHSRILYGDLQGRLTGRGDHVQRLSLSCTGAAAYRAANNQLRLLLLNRDGTGQVLRISADGQPWEQLGAPPLETAKPVTAYTSLAVLDDDTLLAAADGQVLVFTRTALPADADRSANPDAIVWRETARWAAWGDAPDARFGAEIWIQAHGGRLWVADSARHRVLCFDAATRQLRGQFGQTDSPGATDGLLHSPTQIAADGDLAVVYDSANHRLQRLAFRVRQ